MMWIDIAVTVLLTLRIALLRPVLLQLLDSNGEAVLPEGKDEQQECLFVGHGEVDEDLLLESPHQGTVELSQ